MPPTLLIPIANHMFSPERLAAAVEQAEKDHPGKANVLKGTVDSQGVNVVLALGNDAGTWKVQTAFTKDWTGSVAFGASGSVAW